MAKVLIAIIVSIAFLLILSAVDSATNVGKIVLENNTVYFQGGYSQLRLSVLQEVNRVRAMCGFPPYQLDTSLMVSAQKAAEAVARTSTQVAGHPFGLNGPHGFKYFQQNSVGPVSNASEAVNGWWYSGREDYGGPNGCVYLGDRGGNGNQGGHRSNLLSHPVYKYAGVGATPIGGGYTITLDIGG